MKFLRKLVTYVVRIYIVFAIIFTYWYIYDRGVDDGYWEHEGEENAYGCEVITGSLV